MAEKMNEQTIAASERKSTGTSWTRNEQFDKDGYIVVKNLWDPEDLYHPLPNITGQLNYYDKNPEHYNHQEVEGQVEGSLARYWHPQYRLVHTGVRKKLEKIIGRKLYNTYYYDRYYFPGQELSKHTDRDACEISVTCHISTNIEEEWPIKIKGCDGLDYAILLKAGDALMYKGCENVHWRDPCPSKNKKRSILSRLRFKEEEDDSYYHQVFFHYVLQDGECAQQAFDQSR